ncbi:MAG: Ig-like domain-containing protein [Gemmatimonadota bacterium]
MPRSRLLRYGAALAALLAGSSCGGDSAPSQVTPPASVVTSIEVTPSLPTLEIGSTMTMSATVRDQRGAAMSQQVQWTSSSETVAQIGASTGLLTPTGPGTTTISASAGGKLGTTTLTVFQTVASLFIDSIPPKLYVGKTAQLVFQVRDAIGVAVNLKAVTWTSSAPSVATISPSGLLTGVSLGTTQITGVVDGKTASRSIVVQPLPQVFVTMTPENASLARGADYALTPSVTDLDGKPLAGRVVTYSTSDASIATVTAAGVVHPIANGVATITALVDGQDATSRVTVLDPRTVSGTVYTADGASPANVAFTARFGGGVSVQRFVAPVNAATGAFSLVIPFFATNAPVIEYFVDIASGTSRPYHPSYVRLSGGAAPVNSRIVLVPHTVVPDSGTYAGKSFAVDLNEAFTPVCPYSPVDANCQSYWPNYWLSGGIKNWPDAARPIPLAIDRTPGPATAADSTAMWTIIRIMEADLGRQLFKPVIFSGYTTPGYTNGQVLVSFDASLSGFAGYTNWFWDASASVVYARIRLAGAQYFARSDIVSHELTHALGFSHTCRWTTIMGGYSCTQTTRLSQTDVAYYHLAELVRRKSAAVSATWSVQEGLDGVRVLELKLPAPDAVSANVFALKSRIGLPGSDASP